MKHFTFFCLALSIGLFSFKTSTPKKFEKKSGFVFIPQGKVQAGETEVSVNAFYMLDHEVTNAEYMEFINDAFLNKGDSIGAVNAMPDTNAWQTKLAFNQPFVVHYHRHPAFANYPVVNISKENAMQYCKWLSEKLKETYPEMMINEVRLPEKSEWIYAARGGLNLSPYPWGGPHTRNSKGCYLANFLTVSNSNITKDINGNLKVVSGDDFIFPRMPGSNNFSYGTVLTKSYTPNGYGLYNMSGNVAEMIATDNLVMGGGWKSPGHDIQVTSEAPFSKPNPTIGFRPVMSYILIQK